MNIIYAEGNDRHEWACAELGSAYRRVRGIIQKVVREFESVGDERTLVIVNGCPCCDESSQIARAQHRLPNTVLVSPLCGIDPSGMKRIVRMDKYPPFRDAGVDRECATDAEYETEWRNTLTKALSVVEVPADAAA